MKRQNSKRDGNFKKKKSNVKIFNLILNFFFNINYFNGYKIK